MAYLALAVSALLVCIDQITKWIVSSNMTWGDTVSILKIGDTEVFNFTYCLNDGAAFSILEGKRWFLIGITTVAIIIGIVLLLSKRVKKTRYIWVISVIIAGGVGNLIDRVFNDGQVVDFIEFRLFKFAIFNVADIFATCGAIALLVFMIYDEIKESRDKKKAALASEKTNTEVTAGEESTSDGEETDGTSKA